MVRPDLIGLPIYKMTGSGNDFVMVAGRLSQPGAWRPEEMKDVCARGTGVGADGLVFVSPGAEPGAARMVYYNSDGSHAAMCGNAALCSTRLAVHLGIVRGPTLKLETDAGVYEGRYPGQGERSELHPALDAGLLASWIASALPPLLPTGICSTCSGLFMVN